MSMEIVAADIGGTHARFAIAEVGGGRVQRLDPEVTLKAHEYASLQTAWQAFGEKLGRPLPSKAGIAIAAPVTGEVLKLTNNPWVIRPALIAERLGVDEYTLVNDFGAVGHAVAQVDSQYLEHLCGPEEPLAQEGVISVIGAGTGLGVAAVLRASDRYHVIQTEGGHIDYAPIDGLEDAILRRLRHRYRRVSAERLVSGPGLGNIYEALAVIEDRKVMPTEDADLWAKAICGEDALASAALDRFLLSFGSVAGDIALAQGAKGLVIAGGIAPRVKHLIPLSGFSGRFTAKGRFEAMMAQVPVKMITHPQPGLYGAAAAFAEEHSR
jgi:glucokinase